MYCKEAFTSTSQITMTDRFSLSWSHLWGLCLGQKLYAKAVIYGENDPGKVAGEIIVLIGFEKDMEASK